MNQGRGYPPPPGNLHGYQNKGVARWAVWNCKKTKEIARGKKGKQQVMSASAKLAVSEWRETRENGRGAYPGEQCKSMKRKRLRRKHPGSS